MGLSLVRAGPRGHDGAGTVQVGEEMVASLSSALDPAEGMGRACCLV